MVIIPITYKGQQPEAQNVHSAVTCQSGTMRVKFTFSPEWDAFPHRTVVFASRAAVLPVIISADGFADIPPAVIAPGATVVKISVFGIAEDENAEIPRYTGGVIALRLEMGSAIPTAGTGASAYEQLLVRVISIEAALGEAVDYAEQAAAEANAAAVETKRATTSASSATAAADKARQETENATQQAATAKDNANAAAAAATGAADRANAAAARLEWAADRADEFVTTAVNSAASATASQNAAANSAASATASQNAAANSEKNAAANAAQVAADLEESKQALASAKTEIRTETDAQIERVAEAAAEKVGEISDIGTVLYNAAMNLTDAEKGSARGNISAASAIVERASGETIAVDDSAQQPFAGMRIYGKSTQDGTPTPDAPVPIVSIGDGGSVGATVAGKNIFDKNNVKKIKRYFTADGAIQSSSETRSLYITCYHKKPYFISKIASKRFFVGFCATDPIAAGATVTGVVGSTDGKTTYTVTAPNDAKYLVIFYYHGGVDTLTEAEILDSIMVSVSDTESPYEPYIGQSLPISTPDGLRGIPVKSGGNYTDASGQQYIADYVDLTRGVLVRNVLSDVFDGSGDRITDRNGTKANTYQLEAQLHLKSVSGVSAISNYGYAGTVAGVASAKTGVTLYVSGAGETKTAYLVDSSCDTLDELKAKLSETPLIFIAQLATPIETPLTAEEIAAYRALMTNHGYTTVFNDAGAHMDVDYAADTKLYIDKKIAALSAAILENNA